MSNQRIRIPRILMPREGSELYKWAVIACDQFTSQPEYWQETEKIVGDAPSTLHLTLPEVYLEDADVSSRIEQIHSSMTRYREQGILTELPSGMVLTERFSGGSAARRGLVLSVDLECYDFKPGSQSLIRPTEKTVEERIPPRLAVRRGASLELPHIMLLIDDPDRTVIEPLFERTGSLTRLYDTDLMQGGGHISGWFLPEGQETDAVLQRFDSLCARDVFNKKYGCTDAHALLPFAVGDGNHSMATAKAYWDEIKGALSPDEREKHPARFALVEVVNIHDESLLIEPIHRVVFGVDPEQLLSDAIRFFEENGGRAHLTDCSICSNEQTHAFSFCTGSRSGTLTVASPKWAIPIATLQAFLDHYLAQHTEVKIDYIHGADVVRQLGQKPGNIGFLLPDIEKNDLFRGVIFDGVLPRKTFSMGEAHEKRYYMEAKSIL